MQTLAVSLGGSGWNEALDETFGQACAAVIIRDNPLSCTLLGKRDGR